jgi:hypothetical protein
VSEADASVMIVGTSASLGLALPERRLECLNTANLMPKTLLGPQKSRLTLYYFGLVPIIRRVQESTESTIWFGMQRNGGPNSLERKYVG